MINGVFISLQFRHPSEDVSVFCKTLGLVPLYTSIAGQPRKTPRGAPLKGHYLESYCTCDVPIEKAECLEEGLAIILHFLSPHRENLINFSKQGGTTSLFTSLEKGVFAGAKIGPELLSGLGNLQISFDIDRHI